jgi:hypothetical protein
MPFAFISMFYMDRSALTKPTFGYRDGVNISLVVDDLLPAFPNKNGPRASIALVSLVHKLPLQTRTI